MTIRKFEAVVHITSPTSANTKLVANVNPNISFIPNSLLEFIMKHLAGVLLAKLQSASKKASQHPVTNVHAIRMREEKEFYQHWLMAKFQGTCEMRGWDMPPVAALHLSEKELVKAQRLRSHGNLSRAQTFSPDSPEERIVENLAAVSSSENFAIINGETMSQLSNDTGRRTVWNNNPVGAYLRETEQKVLRRKEEKVAAIRRRAADRLQPTGLPSDQLARLAALKQAKVRRMGDSESNPRALDEPLESPTLTQRFARQLYDHEPRTRLVVVSVLVCILFLMLHPEPLWRQLRVEFDPSAPWHVLLVEDFGMIVYVCICAVPHFLLCDVALVYAFDAMELGSKTGHHVKMFYSDNVRLAVMVGSLGIVAVSVLKAALKVWLRGFLSSVVQVHTFFRVEAFERLRSFLAGLLLLLPEEVRSTCAASVSTVTEATEYAAGNVVWALGSPLTQIRSILFESNIVGREVARVLRACVSALDGVAQWLNAYVKDLTITVEGKSSILPWRMEVFDTARLLFMYTAVFLLTVLVMFHISAPKPRSTPVFESSTKSSPLDSPDTASSEDSDSPLPAEHQSPAGGTRQYEAIPEDDAVFYTGIAASEPFTPSDEYASGSRTSNRRKLRFRARRTASLSSIRTTARPSNGIKEEPTVLHHGTLSQSLTF